MNGPGWAEQDDVFRGWKAAQGEPLGDNDWPADIRGRRGGAVSSSTGPSKPLRCGEEGAMTSNGVNHESDGHDDVDEAMELAVAAEERTGVPHEVVVRGGKFCVRPVPTNVEAPIVPRPAGLASGDGKGAASGLEVRAFEAPLAPELVTSPGGQDSRADLGQREAEELKALLAPRRHKTLRRPRFQMKQSYRSQALLCVLATFFVLTAAFPGLLVALVFSDAELADLPPFLTLARLKTGIAGFSVVACVYLLLQIIKARLVMRFAATEDYVASEEGLISRKGKRVLYGDIKNIVLEQTALGRILGFGDLDFYSASGTGVDVQFRNVAAPTVVRAVIEARIREARRAGDKYAAR